MGWLWETERTERRRGFGLMLVAFGGLAPLAVAAGIAGVMLTNKASDSAAAPIAAAQFLDCALQRNAWRSACRPATMTEAPAPASPAVDEAPKTTGALERKTARASSKLAKPDMVAAAAPEASTAPVTRSGTQKPIEEARPVSGSEDQPAPARAVAAVADPASKAEPAVRPAPEPRTVRKASPPQAALAPGRIGDAPRRHAAAEPARLARHRARRVAAAEPRPEPVRPAPQAAMPASQGKPLARPRIRDAGESWAHSAGSDGAASAGSRRGHADRATPREASVAGAAPRVSKVKIMILPIPIAFKLP